MNHAEYILKKPLLTEKATGLSENYNRYSFEVSLKANKYEIKNAVEKMFNVKVLDIKTSTTAGKTKRAGKSVKKLQSVKRAYVRVKEGQKIEFFKGI